MDARDLGRHGARSLMLHAAIAAASTAQPLAEQPLLPESPSVPSAELTGAARPASNRAITEDLVLAAGGTLERIEFVGSSPEPVFGFVVRVVRLNSDDTEAVQLSASWAGIGRFDIDPRQDGLYDFGFTLPEPVRLEPGERYGVQIRALLLRPDLNSTGGWTWAGGEGDGTVIVDELDGSPPFRLAQSGVALALLGASDANECVADVNGDGVLSPGDFTAWVAAYNSGDNRADQNGDGMLSPADFTAWIANYNEGC